MSLATETDLAAMAAALVGPKAASLAAEIGTLRDWPKPDPKLVAGIRRQIAAGDDPLGAAFSRIRPPARRRADGAVYTPAVIVKSMVAWAAREKTPARIVDPGAGSGRFILAAAERFPSARLIAVEIDPPAALMLRANATVRGLSDRVAIVTQDYRSLELPAIEGPTLFIGNPPYVRHHDISETWKGWFARTAAAHGFKASKLAGLHVHFFLKTYELARPGDYGAFITASEWLDVNYGAVLRRMLTNGLGVSALTVLAPAAMPFADAITTGAITCFEKARRVPSMIVRSVESIDHLGSFEAGKQVSWSELDRMSRWSTLTRPTGARPKGYISLGELFRVHRGQVTGANGVWIAGAYPGRLPVGVLFPAVTRARELFAAAPVLESSAHLRRVIDLPIDLDALSSEDRQDVERFLAWARARGAQESYIARHRAAWWSVGLKPAAPILCTYMARRPPAFVRNRCEARHVNIAHGLYPRERLAESDLVAIAAYLARAVGVESGRTYAGGLTKFEPGELERLLIPRLDKLHELAAEMDSGTAAQRRA